MFVTLMSRLPEFLRIMITHWAYARGSPDSTCGSDMMFVDCNCAVVWGSAWWTFERRRIYTTQPMLGSFDVEARTKGSVSCNSLGYLLIDVGAVL